MAEWLLDVLSLVKYLNDNGFIFLSKNDHPQIESDKIYNKDVYEIKGDGKYWIKCHDAGITTEIMGVNYKIEPESAFSNYNITTLYCNLSILLNKYAHGLVYPSQILVEYVQNDFKTEEQLKFEQQMSDTQTNHTEAMKTANRTLRWTRWASVIALVTFLISGIVSFAELFSIRDMTIRDLNNTIKEKNIPDVVPVKIVNDTIKTIITSSQIDNQAIKKQDAKK